MIWQGARSHFNLLSIFLNTRVLFFFKFARIFPNNYDDSLAMIEKLPGSDLYDSFAYDIAVLKYFVGKSQGGGRQRHSGSTKKPTSSRVFGKIRQSLDSSLHSVSGRIRASLDWSGHSSNSGRMRPASMDGSNHSYTAKKVAQFPITARPAAPLS